MRTTSYPSRPGGVVDPNSTQSSSGRQIEWALIPEKYRRGAVAVTVTEAALAAAETLVVAALGAELPRGRSLDFGGGVRAVVAETAAKGAEEVTVEALADPVADNAVAYFQPAGMESAGKVLPALKVMSVYAATQRLVTRAERPGAETAAHVLKTPAVEDSVSDSKSGYGTYVGGGFYENLMPDADPATGLLPAAFKNELRAAGGSFFFEQYGDDR